MTQYKVWIAKVFDGANFEQLLEQHGYSSENLAETLGSSMRDNHRQSRRLDGETDEVFIEAIYYLVEELLLD